MKTLLVQPNVSKGCLISEQARNAISLSHVMAYQFDPLIHRMVDKHGWSEDVTRACWEDLKRFLYLCAITPEPVAPTEQIDDLWHNYILFTMDYAEFCETVLGKFIHHRPRKRGDMPTERNIPFETRQLAMKIFGDLSGFWRYKNMASDCLTCAGGPESCSGGSTNCQD